jgi:hypothetical protein
MNLVSVLLVLGVGAVGCVGAGFICLAMLHWAWNRPGASAPGEGWPIGQRLLIVGAILGITFGILKLVLWQWLPGTSGLI